MSAKRLVLTILKSLWEEFERIVAFLFYAMVVGAGLTMGCLAIIVYLGLL